MGIRECEAHVQRIRDFEDHYGPTNKPSYDLVRHPEGFYAYPYNADLGYSFYGTDWDSKEPVKPNYFTHMVVENGVVHYRSWEEVIDGQGTISIKKNDFSQGKDSPSTRKGLTNSRTHWDELV